MYKKVNHPKTNEWVAVCIPEENKYIPFDNANIDYQEYLEWVAEGNEPEPAE